MALTSSSTYADAEAQYLDNLGWRTDRSKAVLALEAVDYMILKRPKMSGAGGTSMTFEELRALQDEMAAVVAIGSANRCTFTRGVAIRE